MTDASSVRMGVIGAGWFASRRHIPRIVSNPHSTLAALCRRDAEALEAMNRAFSPKATYTDWEQMLDSAGLDAVLIATPHAMHYAQARAALMRGMHVLLEKPMALRGAEAADLIEIANNNRLVLGVALNPPFWGHCHRIRQAIAGGKLGSIESAIICFSGNADFGFGRAPMPANLPGIVPPTLFRGNVELNGGGYLVDGGSHLVSQLLWATGLRATSVSAVLDRFPDDRRAELTIALDGGVLASISAVGDSRMDARRVYSQFAGSAGTAVVEGPEFKTTISAAGCEPETFCEADLPATAQPVDNFLDAVLGRGELYSPGDHGAQVVEVIEAAYESARTGRVVALPNH